MRIAGQLKCFRILTEHYKNRRKRFYLRMILTSIMVNLALLNQLFQEKSIILIA